MMNKILILICCFSVFCIRAQKNSMSQFKYDIELKDNPDDVVKVRLKIKNASLSNDIFQFVSSAPGTYQIIDMGRFIKNLKAYDGKGKIIATEKIATNQWKISKPKKVAEIYYEVADTWDADVKEQYFYSFAGMTLEKDHALINSYCIIGYFSDYEKADYKLSFHYPKEWSVGTSAKINENGYYEFNSFAQLADSPFLFGRLSKASFIYDEIPYTIYVYSQNDEIAAGNIKGLFENAVRANTKFIKKRLPVDHYTFLVDAEKFNIRGTLEYSNSSVYVMPEKDLSDTEFHDNIMTDAAHELFHLVTPINVRSEYISNFNFASPKASEHLWLYEGTAEWASDIMMLRNGTFNLPRYLEQLSEKLTISEKFDSKYSISQLALNCYTETGRGQYENIYHRTVIALDMIDIMILDMSDGKRGLREVILELNNMYGKDKPFEEKNFFSVFTKMTYPEVGVFLDKYIKNTEVMPIEKIFEKVGVKYTKERKTGDQVLSVGYELFIPDGKIKIRYVTPELKKMGLEDYDEFVSFNDIETRLDNQAEWLGKFAILKPNESYVLKVKRDEKIITVPCKVITVDQVEKHIFEMLENPNERQKKLQECWTKNL
ncbi:putative metalloprotease with PDZ domain [Chryseobacterium sp. 52]|nr:putative metalloprotease with PDZ domain [Chryseobacterium sp. 52]